MQHLFFSNLWSILSTTFILVILAFIIQTITKHNEIERWGRRILFLTITGILLCIFVVMRDDYALALQGGAGLFSLESMQINLAYIAAGVIGISSLSTIFVHNQKYRKTVFFIVSAAILFKVGLIEISRMMML